MIHIWTEDNYNSASVTFWKSLVTNRVSSKLVNVDVQGFNGNSKLVDYLMKCTINPNDVYIIFIDKVVDNASALAYYQAALTIAQSYSNMYITNLLSFEYMMLRFKYFVNWTEPKTRNKGYAEAIKVREEFIKCVDKGISWTNSTVVFNYIIKNKGIDITKPDAPLKIAKITSENVNTTLLSVMTNASQPADFKIMKTYFGDCWKKECCLICKSMPSVKNKCRLYGHKKTSQEKAKNLWNGTLAKQIINNIL